MNFDKLEFNLRVAGPTDITDKMTVMFDVVLGKKICLHHHMTLITFPIAYLFRENKNRSSKAKFNFTI